MGSKYVSNRSAVQIGLESTSGTYETPVSVLPLEKGDGVWEPGYDKDESNPVSGYHGSRETQIITDFSTVDITSKMKLPADHTLITAAFGACGVSAAVITGGVSYGYVTADKSTASMLQTLERKTTAVYGARGDFSLMCEVGKAAEISFAFKALLHEVVQLATEDDDNTIPLTPSFDKVYMTKNCTAYLVNGNQAHFKKITLNQNSDVKAPKDTCPGPCYTDDTKPELQVVMSITEDNEDAFDDLKSGTEFNFIIPLFDATGTKKWELLSPKCVVIEQKTPENEGRLDVERTLECRKTIGDDNWELRNYTA